jgi:hypothetical protein
MAATRYKEFPLYPLSPMGERARVRGKKFFFSCENL